MRDKSAAIAAPSVIDGKTRPHIDSRPATGGKNPDRDRQAHRKEHRADRQLQCRRIAIPDMFQHRTPIENRLAPIPLHNTGQKFFVLFRHRQIEPQIMAHPGPFGRQGLLAQNEIDRIARHRMQQKKDERRNAKQNRDQQKESFEKITFHGRRLIVMNGA